ncbi:uncharacterized protein [Dermacentor andersoni]|uniref:uncharacterized protein n=1 Tax=Dermacentor andersoni TaxID=34620 RepID=UPI002155D1AD|nr:uncharacterized protein LOC126528274 [Dermacentor andersoni]
MQEGSSEPPSEHSRTNTEASVLQQEADSVSSLDVTEPQPDPVDSLPRATCCYLGLGSAVTCKYDGTEVVLVKPTKQPGTLDGYAFNLACKFETKRGKISSVCFLFTLCAGNEDDLVPWPFAKQVSLRIVDTQNRGKDVSVPVKIRPEQDADCFRRPIVHAPQKGILSERIGWKQVNRKKLVRDDCLVVAVQFQ